LVRRLRDKERQVIEMHFFGGQDLVEVGRRMGFSGARAGFLKRRGLERLRRLLS
jgi:DNA-directed RNA polymerase specialized sigma subunit